MLLFQTLTVLSLVISILNIAQLQVGVMNCVDIDVVTAVYALPSVAHDQKSHKLLYPM